MSEFLTDLKRTHDCGALRAADVGKRVVLFGWVAARRDHGGCVFIDLRDRDGLTQVVFEPSVNADAHALAGELRCEFCIGVAGDGRRSRRRTSNPKLATGEIEVKADALDDLLALRDAAVRDRGRHRHQRDAAPQAPLPRSAPARAAEELPACARRSTRPRAACLAEHGFLEIETPFMVKYTPGGARNFLVPSRLNPGSSTRSPSRRRSSSSCSWSRASTATSRSCAASATRTCASTASPSSPRSTSRCASSSRRTSRP